VRISKCVSGKEMVGKGTGEAPLGAFHLVAKNSYNASGAP